MIFIIIIVICLAIYANRKNISNKEIEIEATIDNGNQDFICGIYIYNVDNTSYEFREDNTGVMISNGYEFEYKYTTQNGKLYIDFVDDNVGDVRYSYFIEKDTLKLVSEEGTVSVGKEYKLERKNK